MCVLGHITRWYAIIESLYYTDVYISHDHAITGGRGGFSTDGCTQTSATSTAVECECNHLTSFAVLLVQTDSSISLLSSVVPLLHAVSCLQDVSPQEEERKEEEVLALEVITYIGLSISIITLILTIVTYLFSR